VIGMNREALAKLRCNKQLVIIPGATHLFEEPGTLEEVARLAAGWFKRYLVTTEKRRVGAPGRQRHYGEIPVARQI
jgi:hypothetical protein